MVALAPRYLRRARVEVGLAGEILTVDNLRITFSIRQESQPGESPSKASIYNLTREHQAAIADVGQRVRVWAGYANNLALLADGEILKPIERQREHLDSITTMRIGGFHEALAMTNVAISYEGEVAVDTVVSDLVSEMGMALGPLPVISSPVLEDFAYNGPARMGLTEILRPRGIEWYHNGNIINFAAAGTTTGVQHIIDEMTGMVGVPTPTDDGIRVKVLLTPTIGRGDLIQVRSSVRSGVFKVLSLLQKGDTREGDMVTEIEAANL